MAFFLSIDKPSKSDHFRQTHSRNQGNQVMHIELCVQEISG
jgi:hypothetical protein